MLKLTRLSATFSVFAGTLLSAGALAQSQETPQLERVIVTGSNIKRTDTETASPVQVLTRDDIEKTGKQSLQEVLRGVTADGQGSIPTSFTAGFASGSASVSLRGLGVNSTLVLINGRRMTTYGLADDGARTFVDLNTIPLEAVERIEVLKDGASAIYGADAVGGVVNVILRKAYNGGAIGGSYGQSGHSDGQTTRAFGTLGFGKLDSDKYNVFVSLEASKQKHIMSTDRGFLGNDDLTQFGFYDTTNGAPRPWIGAGPSANSPYGGIRANPDNSGARLNVSPCPVVGSNGLCRFNSKEYQEIQPAIDRLNLFGRGTLQFSPTMQAYVEIGLFSTKSKSIGLLGANNDGGIYNPSTPDTPIVVHPRMNLPAGHPDNPLGGDRLLGLRPFDFGGRNRNTDSQVTRLVEGLQGSAFGWDYDFGAAYIASRLKDRQTGFIRYSVMQDALNNGTYRINNPGLAAPGVLAAISPTLEETPTSSVKLIDFKATRDLMALPGGPLGLALGAESRWESANTPPVPLTSTGEIVGLGYSAFSAKRRVWALYGELTAPVAKWLELNMAVRSDQYSDFGNSTTPKLGFKLMPMEQLAVRGTYAEAFRAPGPAERGGSTFGFTTVGILTFGNPDLKPEKSKSYTLGLIFEPASGTSATLDFYSVDRKNEIVPADTATILYPGVKLTGGVPLSKIPGASPNTFIYYDDQGQLATVSGLYQNAASTKTNGVDIELRHKMSLGEAGKLSAQLNWTHVNKFQRTDINGNTLDYAGTHGPIVLSSGAGTPKDRASLSLTWDRQPFALTGVVNYVGGMKLVDHKGERATQNIDPDTGLPDGTVTDNTNGLTYADGGNLNCAVFNTDGSPSNNCRLPSFTTFDLFAKWTPIKNLDINFSIQNLFDRRAPFDPYLALTYGMNYNQTWHQAGAVGRFFSIGAKYSF
jgi:iron complex outermembrane recepter protein